MFNKEKNNSYERMVYWLQQSIEKHLPGAELKIIKVKPPLKNGKINDNEIKMREWAKIKDSSPYILMDADMIVTGNLAEGFFTHEKTEDDVPYLKPDLDFDIGITKRTSGTPPYNVGVVFVRPSKKTEKFFELWYEAVQYLLRSPVKLKQYQEKYWAICQPALGFLIEENRIDFLNIKWLSCSEFNACDEDWKNGLEYKDGKLFSKSIHLKTKELQAELFLNNGLAYHDIKKVCGQYKSKMGYKERKRFIEWTGYEPNIEKPRTYNEKITWKKHNDRNPLIVETSDKIKVRDYLAVLGFKDYLVPAKILYNPLIEEIPDCGVAKPNNAAGRILFLNVYRQNKYKAWLILQKWLTMSYGTRQGEWAYGMIDPGIIVEKRLSDEPSDAIKVLCFNGIPKYVYYQKYHFFGNMVKPTCITMYDCEWKKQSVTMLGYPNPEIKYPKYLNELIGAAFHLAKPFDFVRIDFHALDDRFYFNEFTHYPTSGTMKFEPMKWDKKLGDLWTIKK
jgi:hypothetical protein